ncbi:glycoside hydrolase family protein [Edaphobacillus lindanitolerans]|uniref:Poly(Glycerol-phosphate) alpha-glucosyltransferase n=1 Tax=Edaphobacillus lindanitolerans TaxID=550447 RepID=A0A1U7PLL5_9BACI|nr:hypothetical protein [Edaphobacillus lindanitolerans]SIT74601.1 hypothetical protein SAMN05428946_1092 [Edaphobacillus lindanitolerans]
METNRAYLQRRLSELEQYFLEKIRNGELKPAGTLEETQWIVFLSIGNPTIRAKVVKAASSDFRQAFDRVSGKAEQLVTKNNLMPDWIKVDVVSEKRAMPFSELDLLIKKTRKNYFRHGISFDGEFRTAFLEQEINGNAMIKAAPKQPLALDDQNINRYLSYRDSRAAIFSTHALRDSEVWIFRTMAAFAERETGQIRPLYNGDRTNGIRLATDKREEIRHLIEGSTGFLTRNVKQDGQFEYGYFAAFAKRIGTYNILRHASSLYAMLEGYEVTGKKETMEAVERGLEYLIREALVYKNEGTEKTAFIVDYANGSEIKLGSNATAILALSKYMDVTGSKRYITEARALAKGIIKMKTVSGGFVHVLSYPSLEIKELHRIIYYEGEAVFALLRLYAIDRQPEWLQEAKASFDYFIRNRYWTHHDHWLSYAVNELTLYEPEPTYFEFGLKNCQDKLGFIYHRETTYPTFLELTMAAYKMIKTMQRQGQHGLLDTFNVKDLEDTIERRAEYQRVGYFYPELAMYMKQPGLVLDGFFIRHHSFRVRIDDVEHYLSGYCQYYHDRLPDLPIGYEPEMIKI